MYDKSAVKKLTLVTLLLIVSLFKCHAQIESTITEQLYEKLPQDVVPELAAKGQYSVGVRTIKLINPAQFDVQTQSPKDRELTVETWYPSDKNDTHKKASYENETRSGITFSIQGDAYRDSEILEDAKGTKFPLVVISHGYTGYRTLMFYLGEHLASHGYIVAAIDHTDSTNGEVDMKNSPFSGFLSTLLNRSRDQQFTLTELTNKNNFTSAIIDTQNAGLIGYSMGGYGAINTIGGCYNYSDMTSGKVTGLKDPEKLKQVTVLLNSCAGGQYQNVKVDPKWKATIAISPWGGEYNIFNQDKLASIKTPILYIAGSLDDISGYSAIQSLYDNTGSDKYLLTYENARHNIAAHPAPSNARTNELDIGHYHDATWSSIQLNNTNKHFSLAMMDCYVKKIPEKCSYLDLSKNSNQNPVSAQTSKPWKGFDHRYSTGMLWRKQLVK